MLEKNFQILAMFHFDIFKMKIFSFLNGNKFWFFKIKVKKLKMKIIDQNQMFKQNKFKKCIY